MKAMGIGTIGSDPELSVWTEDGNPAMVCGLLGGTKQKPKRAGKCGHYQEDNVNAEINPKPSKDPMEVADNILELKEIVANKLAKHDLVVKPIPYLVYPTNTVFPEAARRAGCDPDYNAYTRRENPPPRLGLGRSAGGHLLMEVPRSVDLVSFVKTADLVIGVACAYHDTDKQRQAIYGKAGAFRATILNNNVGIIEYRTPSNWWLRDEKTIRWMLKRWSGMLDYVELFKNDIPVFNFQIKSYVGGDYRHNSHYNDLIEKGLLQRLDKHNLGVEIK